LILFFSLSPGGDSDPVVVAFRKDPRTGFWLYVDRTDVVMNESNPDFLQTIVVDYDAGSATQLQFCVYDIDRR
jgi:hypothetical protein